LEAPPLKTDASGDSETFLEIETEDDIPFPAEDDSPELRQLREEGATPMTPAPENTSYLEEDALIASPLDEDLAGGAIDEPDLSGPWQENPIAEEPSIDNSMDDTEDAAGEDTVRREHTEQEMPLDDSFADFDLSEGMLEDETLDQVIPEGFVVESTGASVSFDDTLGEEESVMVEKLENDFSADSREDDFSSPADAEIPPAAFSGKPEAEKAGTQMPAVFKQELRTVLSYMDKLLESLPEEKIEEFAKSEHFDAYKKLFEELGLV
jgi:hypothetical protein